MDYAGYSLCYEPESTTEFETCIYTHTLYIYIYIFLHSSPNRATAVSLLRFLDHARRDTTVDRAPLDERSAPRRDLYLTAHSTQNR